MRIVSGTYVVHVSLGIDRSMAKPIRVVNDVFERDLGAIWLQMALKASPLRPHSFIQHHAEIATTDAQ